MGSSQGKVVAVPDGAEPAAAFGAVESLSGEIADRWAELGRSGMMPDGLGLPELACDVATLANMVVALSAQLRAALQLPPA